MSKSIFASKTFWINALSLILVVLQWLQGQPWIDPQYQVAILTIVNIINRFFTKDSVHVA